MGNSQSSGTPSNNRHGTTQYYQVSPWGSIAAAAGTTVVGAIALGAGLVASTLYGEEPEPELNVDQQQHHYRVNEMSNCQTSYVTTRAAMFPPASAESYPSPQPEEDEEIDCPPSFICPITQEIMTDPVLVIESGMTYEKYAIEDWFRSSCVDPMTNQQLSSLQFVPVLTLKNAISEWREIQAKKKETV